MDEKTCDVLREQINALEKLLILKQSIIDELERQLQVKRINVYAYTPPVLTTTTTTTGTSSSSSISFPQTTILRSALKE